MVPRERRAVVVAIVNDDHVAVEFADGERRTIHMPGRIEVTLGIEVRIVDTGDPNAAIRARLNALVLDGLIMSPVVVLTLVAFGLAFGVGATSMLPPRRPAGADIAIGLLSLAYFFSCEARWGQTIGKRAFHIRVVRLDGAPLRVRDVAIRNLLRVIDGIPGLNAVGAVSVMWTGVARRQRVGDFAAGTTVVLDDVGPWLRTPRWLLPVLTVPIAVISAALVVLVIVVLLFVAGPPAPPAPVQRPLLGSWEVHGTATSAFSKQTNLQIPIRLTTAATWTIGRCQKGTECGYVLTMRLPHSAALNSPLYNEPDVPGEKRKADWSTNFPISPGSCVTVGGHQIPTPAHWMLAVTFTANGQQADGTGQEVFTNPDCSYLYQLWNLTATRR